jgi:hypothetical protein
VTAPATVDYPVRAGTLRGGMTVIRVKAEAALSVCTGPDDAGPLREQLAEIAKLAASYETRAGGSS